MAIQIIKNNGQMVVSSREVSENFGKEHRVVLKTIDELLSEMGVAQNNADLFIKSEYQHPQNKQTYREYLLTRDGFSLLVMGFTGKKALEWKLKYIDAFNQMEQQILQPKMLTPTEQLELYLKALKENDLKVERVDQKIDNLKDNMPLFGVESDELQALVRKYGVKFLGGYHSPAYNDKSLRGKVYSDIQGQLKREFGVRSYKAIKRCQLDTAKTIIEKYELPIVLEDEVGKVNNQISFNKEVV